MVKFLDGPAAGQVLALRRAPVMLRVVYSRKQNTWDALDQPDDVAAAFERIYVYRMKGTPTYGFVRFAHAEYILFDPQSLEMEIRDNARWASFCDRVKARVLAMRESEATP